jgi:PAS domain S-box-containing protein
VQHTERDHISAVVDSVKDYAIFIVDPTGRVRTWNEGARLIKGWTRAEILGQSIARFYAAEDVAAGKPEYLLAVAAREGRVEDEGWRVRKDGTRFWADVIITALRDETGELTGFVKVTRDLSARRDAEELLRRSEERMRGMVQELAARATQQAAVADLGLFALRSAHVEDLVTRALAVVCATLGTDVADLLRVEPDGSLVREGSVGWSSPPHPSGLGVVGYSLAHRTGVVSGDLATESRFEVAPRALDAKLRTAATSLLHGPGADSPPRGVLATFGRAPRALAAMDLDFLHAVANVLATAMARSEGKRHVKERDEFISIAAHELRTPLTALNLKLESARQSLAAPAPDLAKLGTRVEGALRQTARLAGLVERLLDVSRIVSGRLELRCEATDIVSLVKRATDDVREQAQRAGCELVLRAPASLVATCDPQRIEQVVANLLSNAIKYGAGKPIDVVVTNPSARAVISVTDRGIGIERADLERIFARFERAAPARHYGGLGLGLYISRRILEAHGGTIRVETTPGRGATFLAELPTENRGEG